MRGTRSLAAAAALTLGALASLTAAALPATADAPVSPDGQMLLGDFEDGAGEWDLHLAGGATAELGTTADDPASGLAAGRLTATIPDGTVEIARWPGPVDATALTLQLRSTDVTVIAIRVQDATGQAHQQRFELAADGTWEQIRIEDFTDGPGYLHFGGADDGLWHGPLQAVSVILDRWAVGGEGSGTLDVDGVTADVEVPGLVVQPVVPGQVFSVGDDVAIGFATEADEIAWTVRDGAGTVVAQGSAATADLDGRLPLALDEPGWYEADLVATAADGTRFVTGTDLAVLTPLPEGFVRDPRFAVATHYGQSWPLGTFDLVAQAGFGLGRDEAYWGGQEQVAGEIVFEDKILAYEDAFADAGVGHFRVLSYGNTVYFEDEAPSTPEDREAFARYAVETVRHLGTEGNVFEVWNEWNWRDLDGAAAGSAAQYVALLEVVHAAVKAEFPDAVLVGPALAPMNDWQGWFTEFAELGGLELVDAVSTHPYTFPQAPEDSARFGGHWQVIRSVMAEHGAADMPIYLSETGWHTSESSVGTDEESQARYVVRGQLLALADGIANVTIYDFMDDGTDPAEAEHRFGIVRNTADPRGAWVPKPAYVTAAVMNRVLAGLPYDRQVDLGDGAYDVVFADGDREVHAAWATTPTVVAVGADGPVLVTDAFGATTELVPGADGRVHVSLDEDPVYLEGAITELAPSETFALAADDEIAGTVTTGRVVVDNGAAAGPLEVDVTTTGEPASGVVAGGEQGEVAVTWAAQDSAATRSYGALVHVDGDPVALLRTTGEPVPALALTGTHVLTDDGEALRLTVTNATSADVVLDRVDWTIGAAAGVVGEGATVPAQGRLDLDAPLADPAAVQTWEALATATDLPAASTAGELWPVVDPVAVPAGTVTVDGVLDASVAAAEPQRVGTDEAPALPGWAGPDDLSASLWFTHDEDHLYLSAEVLDDEHRQPAGGGDTWQGDGLQLGLVAGAPGEQTITQELGVALTADGTVDLWRWSPALQAGVPDGVQAAVVRDDDAATTTYEVAIPWSSVGIDGTGRLLASTVVVNENDGAGRDGWLSWGLGLAESKDASQFRALVLEVGEQPEPEPVLTLRPSVRAQCWGAEAVVAVHVVNTSAVVADIRVTTPWGEQKFSGVAPGAAVYHGFRTGGSAVDAGEVTIAAYAWNGGDPEYQRATHPYLAVGCG